MKKIVIVSGSKRKGNTLAIAEVYSKLFQEKNCIVKMVDLSSFDLSFCDGCLLCDETQTCVYDDGFSSIIDDIRSSDLIIMGSPARWRLMSGELKTFIDRLNPFAAVEGYAGKKIFIYALGQSTEEEGESIINTIRSISDFANDSGMIIVGTQAFYNLYALDDHKPVLSDIYSTCEENLNKIIEEI